MRRKEFDHRRYRINYTNEMDIPTLLARGHSITTFKGFKYIILDNGNLYSPTRREEIAISKIYRHIHIVRNSDGIKIAKRLQVGDKLMSVKYQRRKAL